MCECSERLRKERKCTCTYNEDIQNDTQKKIVVQASKQNKKNKKIK